jgi:predicted ATPase
VLEKIQITNYRSIAAATVEFRPFTLLVGANGSGKSNLLRLLNELSLTAQGGRVSLTRHFNHPSEQLTIGVFTTGHSPTAMTLGLPIQKPSELNSVRVFQINPELIGGEEALAPHPVVAPDGRGAVQVLDTLKTGDHEELFEKIETTLREFIPEIEKLSFVPGTNVKKLQVREKGIATPVLVQDLSEGTRLVLTILTIVYQERKPSIICLEDIDRGLHPRLFGQVVDVCRRLVTEEKGTQIIATTHNPYLVDEFIDDEDSVIVVEKVDSNTTFTKLSDKLKGLEGTDDSLGATWYSGLVGGVPEKPLKHIKPQAGASHGDGK